MYQSPWSTLDSDGNPSQSSPDAPRGDGDESSGLEQTGLSHQPLGGSGRNNRHGDGGRSTPVMGEESIQRFASSRVG